MFWRVFFLMFYLLSKWMQWVQKNLWFLQDVLYLTAAWLLRAWSFYFTMKENKSCRTAVKNPREENEILPGITMMRIKVAIILPQILPIDIVIHDYSKTMNRFHDALLHFSSIAIEWVSDHLKEEFSEFWIAATENRTTTAINSVDSDMATGRNSLIASMLSMLHLVATLLRK